MQSAARFFTDGTLPDNYYERCDYLDICQLRNLKSVHLAYDERVNIEDIKIEMIPCVYKRADQKSICLQIW